jgi:AcrR family transcriptional regulator
MAATERKQRADAQRSVAAILDAAMAVLARRPDASIEDIARAAGVSRQTVYAHYPSRDALIKAVQELALAQTIAAMDAAELNKGPAAEALDRLVAAGWQTLERYPLLMDVRAELSAQEELALHQPILERLERLVRRGRRRGEFDRTMPTNWLLTGFLALSHAAAEEVHAGRMTADESLPVLRTSVRRLYGVSDAAR